MNKRELELYIHIPFCIRKCAYCDFLSSAASERTWRDYMGKLRDEIEGQGENFRGYRVTTIFVGGGTPSILPAPLIEEMFAAVRRFFDVAADAEITIEANPGTLSVDKLRTYRRCGVNRLSIGLQSADDGELKLLGRIHTYDDFLKSYQRARQEGFQNINIDLMSAIPGQDLHSWRSTLRRVMMLRPEHISAYSLIIEEGTPFYEMYGNPSGRMPEVPLPDEETDRAMYHLTKEMMAAQGYEWYEISNYARPGFACRHNIGYWIGTEYLGLGLGASSYTFGFRYRNTEDLGEYLSLNLFEGGAAAREITELSQKDRMEEFMFLGLRRMEGVTGSDFLKRFGQNMWNIYGTVLEKLEAQGLIATDGSRVWLTDLGVDVSNSVFCEFLLDE